MRPITIAAFEWLFLLTIGIGLAQGAVNWEYMTTLAPVSTIYIGQVLAVLVGIVLVVIISRRRSVIAKWLLVIMTVAGLPIYIKMLREGMPHGLQIATFVQLGLQLIALSLLFTPSARKWMAEGN